MRELLCYIEFTFIESDPFRAGPCIYREMNLTRLVNFRFKFYHPIRSGKVTLSYTRAEAFLSSRAYAKHPANLFHVF